MIDSIARQSAAPIFILSCVRSGSTLLRYILDTHPDICSPGELYIGRLCQDLRHVIEHVRNGQEEERKRRVNSEVRRIISAIMSDYARSKEKQVWCEKSPRNLDYLDELKDVFPDARYICLYRHGMDVIQSCLEAAKTGFKEDLVYYIRNRNEISALADSWIEKAKRLLEFERANSGKCFRMKYESLVTKPTEALERLFSFLEIGWDSGLLDKVFTESHDPGPGDGKILFSKSIHARSVGTSSGIPLRNIDRGLLQNLNDLLAELEYPTVGEDWERVAATGLGADQSPETSGTIHVASTADELFAAYIPRRLQDNQHRLQALRGIYKFVVSGSERQVWLVDLTEQRGRIKPGDGDAISTITVSAIDLLDIVSGKLNAAEAFAHGKFQISGDVERAIEMGRILLGG